MKLKRYLVFSYPDYYPGGGWNDFGASFDTLEEAERATTTKGCGLYWDIVDIETGERLSR